MAKAITTLLLMVALCYGQAPKRVNAYTASRENTGLSNSAEVVTIQQPASGSRTVVFKRASIYCSVACTVTLERDGTAATATSLTVVKAHSGAATATATAWRGSDVGVGTVVSKHYIGAGTTLPLDLSAMYLIGDGTAKNLTLRTSAITGTAVINILWEEY